MVTNRYYYAQINIGHPPKPYFLDPDTGSDLTWLQCDAPCVHCTQVVVHGILSSLTFDSFYAFGVMAVSLNVLTSSG